MTISVSVRGPAHSLDWSESFRQRDRRNFPEIVEAYRLPARPITCWRLVVPSIDVYDQVYKRLIAKLEFRTVSASISMEELKFTTAVPLDYLNVSP